jgi:ADP-ribose pyrophosphatase YjhB (NUDIX family)
MVDKRYPIPAVAALIAAPDERVLIVRTVKWSGLWGVPGGKVDYGETLEAALRREMLEEVGLELHDIRFAFNSELIEDEKFHKPMHFVSAEYLARSSHTNVVNNSEIETFAWVTVRQALEYPVNRYTRVLLEYALERGWPERHD